MGKIKRPNPAKLVVGIIARPDSIELAISELERQIAPVEFTTRIIPFDWTDYYEPEMGKGLLRQWVALSGLVEQDEFASIKLKTNDIEMRHAEDGRRRINLDPGLLLPSKFVLATTKDYSHRIYIGRGIFAEVTLIYRKKAGYEPLSWTYPDYRSELLRDFLLSVRKRYMEELKIYLARRMGITME